MWLWWFFSRSWLIEQVRRAVGVGPVPSPGNRNATARLSTQAPRRLLNSVSRCSRSITIRDGRAPRPRRESDRRSRRSLAHASWLRAMKTPMRSTPKASAVIPDRDAVNTSESAMTITAPPVMTTRLASGEANQRRRRCQSGLTPFMLRSMPAENRASEIGRTSSIQPAKWLRLTNGPNPTWPSSKTGVQKP